MQAAGTPPPVVPDSVISQEERWIEMRDLVTRGIFHAETLSAAEVSTISSLALLALGALGKRTAPSDP